MHYLLLSLSHNRVIAPGTPVGHLLSRALIASPSQVLQMSQEMGVDSDRVIYDSVIDSQLQVRLVYGVRFHGRLHVTLGVAVGSIGFQAAVALPRCPLTYSVSFPACRSV